MSVFETGMLRGAALAEQGAVDEAIARIREGVTKWTRLGRTFLLPYGLAFLAQGLVRQRNPHCANPTIAGIALPTASLGNGSGVTRGHGRAFTGCGTTPPYQDRAARRKQARPGAEPPLQHEHGEGGGPRRRGGRVSRSKLANYSLRFTVGSAKASTRSI